MISARGFWETDYQKLLFIEKNFMEIVLKEREMLLTEKSACLKIIPNLTNFRCDRIIISDSISKHSVRDNA